MPYKSSKKASIILILSIAFTCLSSTTNQNDEKICNITKVESREESCISEVLDQIREIHFQLTGENKDTYTIEEHFQEEVQCHDTHTYKNSILEFIDFSINSLSNFLDILSSLKIFLS